MIQVHGVLLVHSLLWNRLPKTFRAPSMSVLSLGELLHQSENLDWIGAPSGSFKMVEEHQAAKKSGHFQSGLDDADWLLY